jgi:hypothetical protein
MTHNGPWPIALSDSIYFHGKSSGPGSGGGKRFVVRVVEGCKLIRLVVEAIGHGAYSHAAPRNDIDWLY